MDARIAMVAVTFIAAMGAAFAATADAVPSKPGIALKRTGAANCATILPPGSEIAFAARVTNGHVICVTHRGEQWAYYLDGKRGGGATGSFTSTFGGIGSVNGDLVVFGNIPSSASSMRLTFCQGQTLILRPLNRDLPQYVGAIINAKKYGPAYQQPADAAGKPLIKGENPLQAACRRTIPATTDAR